MKRSEAIEKMQSAMRLETMSRRTQDQYIGWVNRYFDFIEKHKWAGGETSKDRFQAFNEWMSNRNPQPALSTRKQAYFSVLYLYKTVLGFKMDGVKPPTGRRDQKTFSILTRKQIQELFATLPYTERLIASLMYGTGMRIGECVALRIKDIDFEHSLIYVQEGKGDKARRVDLPAQLSGEIKKQIEEARAVFHLDEKKGTGGVYVPHALNKKNPQLAKSFEWFWLFPNNKHGKDHETGIVRRHHVYDFAIQAAFKIARGKAKLPVYTTPHILRHCYATHYLERVFAEMPQIPNMGEFARDLLRYKMGHVDVKTTDIYIHLATPKNTTFDYSPLEHL